MNFIHTRKKSLLRFTRFRRNGFGSRIHAKLIEVASTITPVFVNCDESQHNEKAFFRKLNYQPVLTCHSLELNLNQISKENPNPEVKSYYELEQSGFKLDKINDFLVERYIEAHQWNPPCEKENAIWKMLLEDQKVDPRHSFAWVEGDRVLAASEPDRRAF